MLTLRFGCAVCLIWVASAAQAAAQQGYPDQYAQQQQYPQQQQYQQYPQQQQYQQYPQQQGADQQQPPPGYFPTPDAQGSYGYQQQYAPNAMYPQQQQQGYGAPEAQTVPLVSSVKGAFQLSAGLSLLQYQNVSASQTGINPAPVVDPAAPPGMPPAGAPVQGLYGRTTSHPLHFEAGYGVTDSILVGALFQLASYGETIEAYGGKTPMNDFAFTVAPKFDYQFSPSSRLNPFIGGVVSLTLHSKKYGAITTSNTLYGIAARAGLRYFVLDQVSLDPLVMLGFNFGSGTQKFEAVPTPIEFENSLSGFQFALAMGVSLYLK